jgi:hypothetical protein
MAAGLFSDIIRHYGLNGSEATKAMREGMALQTTPAKFVETVESFRVSFGSATRPRVAFPAPSSNSAAQ